MVQPEECQLNKLEALGSDPQSIHPKPVAVACPCSPSAAGGPQELPGHRFSFSERLKE